MGNVQAISLVIGAITLFGLVAMFYYLSELRAEFKQVCTNLRQALDRNEVLAASLSKQISETAAPKIVKRAKTNRIVSVTESELARREEQDREQQMT